jgi:heme/copper-type cytochrome/quinol oxidase subunit 3
MIFGGSMTNRAQIGMTMFLISAAVFFFLLILAFKYFAPMPSLNSRVGWLLTALLLAASLSIWRQWRWIATALGVAFLAGLFATISSVLTAIHGLFVIAGIIAIAIVPASATRTVALYWYFFTAVWLVIFVVSSQT